MIKEIIVRGAIGISLKVQIHVSEYVTCKVMRNVCEVMKSRI